MSVCGLATRQFKRFRLHSESCSRFNPSVPCPQIYLREHSQVKKFPSPFLNSCPKSRPLSLALCLRMTLGRISEEGALTSIRSTDCPLHPDKVCQVYPLLRDPGDVFSLHRINPPSPSSLPRGPIPHPPLSLACPFFDFLFVCLMAVAFSRRWGLSFIFS